MRSFEPQRPGLFGRLAPKVMRPGREPKSSAAGAAWSAPCACGGGCPRCAGGRALPVGEPDSVLERQADAAAQAVLAGTNAPLAGQARVAASGATAPRAKAVAPTSVAEVLGSDGHSLDARTRADFQPRLGHDFSNVRLHIGAAAERSAHELGARAYTAGNHIVFGAGQYRPASREGRKLIAHELAHVVQQASTGKALVQRQLLYGAGYANPYASEQEEIASFKAGTWMPSTMDFGATAGTSGGGTGVATVADMFAAIGSEPMHSITELGLIGHGAGGGIGFGGLVSVSPAGVTIATESLITSKSLLANARDYLYTRDRFAEGAVLTLYGCHSGTVQTYLDDLSLAFGIRVRGFTSGLDWCVASGPAGTITSRGRTQVAAATAPASPGCVGHMDDIRTLATSAESRAGVPDAAK